MNRPFRLRQRRTFWGSVLHAIVSALAWLFRMAFGGFEAPLYRWERKRFIREIEREFSWLLAEHNGHILPREGDRPPLGFNYVMVTIEFERIRVRLTRGRGELDAQIASVSDPDRWWDLSLVWHSIAPANPIPSVVRSYELSRLASWIQERFPELVEQVEKL